MTNSFNFQVSQEILQVLLMNYNSKEGQKLLLIPFDLTLVQFCAVVRHDTHSSLYKQQYFPFVVCFHFIGAHAFKKQLVVIRFCFQSPYDFLLINYFVCKTNFKEDNRDRFCVCVCVSACPSQAIPQKLFQVIIIKFGTVTASGIILHHVLNILTLTFIRQYPFSRISARRKF